MYKFIISILFTVGFFQSSMAQEVEHNYLVGPQLTSCDSLELSDVPLEDLVETLRNTNFRFDQTFKLTRKQGLQAGEYFSCDNKVGYMIIKIDGIEHLYKEVDRGFWNNLISSSDPEGFHIENRNQLLQIIE